MTTTLGELKLYTKDYLGDAADGKADRVILRLVNAALQELYGTHRWSRFRERGHVDLAQAVEWTDQLTLVQNSRLAVLSSETFLQAYVDERWELRVESETTVGYAIESVETPQRAYLDKAWLLAGDTRDYAWYRYVYPLPDGCQQIRTLQLSSSGNTLECLSPDAFDQEKFDSPTDSGVPRVYTVRADKLEVWPPLGASTTRQRVLLTYDRQPRLFRENDQNDREVDWDERWRDLLLLAIDVEIATRHAGQTTLERGAAMGRYARRLQVVKSHDEQRVQQARSFMLGSGAGSERTEEYLFRRGPTGADA